jgi:ubiquinone/menaquinone biosynthesis C-methylase UbiE
MDRVECERLLSLYEAGALSGPLMVARLLLVSRDVNAVEQWLRGREVQGERVDELLALIAHHRHGCESVAALVTFFDQHQAAGGGAGCTEIDDMFDRALCFSEEASVALYSLGDAQILEQATAEIVEQLESWGLLGSTRRTLEIGCGTGRMQEALSARVGMAGGVDVAPGMVKRARARCTGLRNTCHRVGSGSNLSGFADASLDLVYAVDSFPYIVAAGDAQVTSTFAEVARVLGPGSDFVIFNYSYRGDEHRDADDVARLAEQHGFAVTASGERPFQIWDGAVFRLRRL